MSGKNSMDGLRIVRTVIEPDGIVSAVWFRGAEYRRQARETREEMISRVMEKIGDMALIKPRRRSVKGVK